MRKLLLLILLCAMAACAPWVQVDGPYSTTSQNFSVDLPRGWMRYNTNNYLYVTRDGFLLQNVLIEQIPIGKPLKEVRGSENYATSGMLVPLEMAKHTTKAFKKDMLPEEAAEVVLDNAALNPAVLDVTLVENVPTTVAGRPGFKVTFTYKNKDELRMKSVYCGAVVGEWFYGIRYTAAARYYFDKDAETFERIVASFRLT